MRAAIVPVTATNPHAAANPISTGGAPGAPPGPGGMAEVTIPTPAELASWRIVEARPRLDAGAADNAAFVIGAISSPIPTPIGTSARHTAIT